MPDPLLFGLRQGVGHVVGHLDDAANNVNVVGVVLAKVGSGIRGQVDQTFRREEVEIAFFGDDGREIGVEEVGVGLVQDLALVAAAVEVDDVDGEGVLRRLVHVQAEGNLAVAEAVHLVVSQHFQKRLKNKSSLD